MALALVLFLTAFLLALAGRRMHGGMRLRGPGRAGGLMIALTWVTSLLVLLAVLIVLSRLAGPRPKVPSPIEPVTYTCAVVAFAVIAYVTRKAGIKVALGSAFVGTAAAPMIFELPFDLIVAGRANAPAYISLIFFSPLLLVEIATLSMLQLSPLTAFTRYTAYSLAAMFAVFGVWAIFGFSYPSDPIPFWLNSVSKVLSFSTAVLLFWPATP